MQITIDDDFNLQKIAHCGQCFRAKELKNGAWRFLHRNNALEICSLGQNRFEADCTRDEWQNLWFDYFDLARNYAAVRAAASAKDGLAKKSTACGAGLRVLRQDPWEMLVTFLISQRKSIPAIAGAVQQLCLRFGTPIAGKTEENGTPLFAFPTPKALAAAGEAGLSACGLGYRTGYVLDAAQKAAAGELNLEGLKGLDDEALFHALLQLRGVGEKVANCVCLFGYGRCARAPVDVWIARAIREECGGKNPFPTHGDTAGLVQQYVFYYMKNHP